MNIPKILKQLDEEVLRSRSISSGEVKAINWYKEKLINQLKIERCNECKRYFKSLAKHRTFHFTFYEGAKEIQT